LRHLLRFSLLLIGVTLFAIAKGTLAGTSINNQANIEFVVGGIDGNISSNADTFVVDRVIDIKLSWEDTAPVEMDSGDDNRVLTFRITNLGNSEENVTLTYEHNASSDFLPQNVRVFKDSNNNGHFDPDADVHIHDINLTADANATLFLVGDIPDDNTTTPGSLSREILHATSDTNATTGIDRPQQIDVVIRKGTAVDTGIWVIRDYWLVTEKNATIHSEDNATHTGTRVTYTIRCYLDGNTTGKTIGNLVVTDTIPSNARYVADSLRHNDIPVTDAVDGDAGEANATQIEVRLGTLNGSAEQNITFDVEIK